MKKGRVSFSALSSVHPKNMNSSHLCHPAMQVSPSVSAPWRSVVSGGHRFGVGVHAGAALCCLGCGLFGNGNMCEICMIGAHGSDKRNSCMMHGMNSSESRTQRNLRVERTPMKASEEQRH